MNTLRIPSVIVVAIAILATPVTIERTFAAANDELQQILESEWEWGLREDPFLAVYIGDSRYADQIPDRSINAYKKRANHTQNILKRLEAIKKDELSPPSILDYDLFYLDVQNRVSAQDFPEELLPINQLDGIHRELNHVARFTPKQSVKHIEYLITRVSQLPTLIDQTIERMQEGLRRGIVPAKMAVANVSSQIASQITANPTESPLFDAMFSDLSSDISKNAEERLKQRAAEVIDKQIYPALRLLQQYWDQEYYPSSRSSIGLSSLPNGLDWYAQKIRFNTSTDMSAEEIHLLGLSEVQRIRGEMTSLMNKLEYDGELADFFHFLRTDPRFYYQTESELLNRYDQIARQTWPNLRRIFGRLPRLPYQISPIPKDGAPSQPTAYYQPGAVETGRPGYFFANTYDLPSRPKWEMEALSLHEAMPGHHLQISLQQELSNLPNFRRHARYTAFIEGWGLYAESLGESLGLYQDKYSKFGQLIYEMWRAVRLVVDTGIHAKGWNKQQAIDFFMDNAGKTEHDVRVEIDRYITWPGQALAYKIGELKFKELRAYAEQELAGRFDIRRFHDQVLGSGSLPLAVLDKKTRAWVSSQSSK